MLKPSISSWNLGYGFGTGELGLFEARVEFVKNREQAIRLARKDFQFRMANRKVKIHSIKTTMIFWNKKFNFKHYIVDIYYLPRNR